MARLTAVICFLDEREEVERTVASLRETAGSNIEILLIDDGSQADYDYADVAMRYGCRYLVHAERVGPAVARSRGVEAAATDQVLLLDAHMRFYARDWWCRIEDALAADPRALYSVRCPPLLPTGERRPDPPGAGAWLRMAPAADEPNRAIREWALLRPVWRQPTASAPPIEAVPCVLGGAYAFDRRFFREIGGHLGLRMYGGEEPYLSVKAWLAGGSCKVLHEVSIGHIYRTRREVPFVNDGRLGVYNMLVLLATTFPPDRFEHYRELLQQMPAHAGGMAIFRRRQGWLLRLRRHLHERVFRRPFAFFDELNRTFRDGASIDDRVGALA